MRVVIYFISFLFFLTTFAFFSFIEGFLWVLTFLFYTTLAFFFLFVLAVIRRVSKRNLHRFGLSIIISVSLLFVADLSFRYVFRIGLTWVEANNGYYKSHYDLPKDRYWLYKPDTDINYENEEFLYKRHTNELGLIQKNMVKHKSKSVYRILTFGDSFTEGRGTVYDSAWPKLVEDILNKKCERRYQVYNAGVAGSDPVYQYMLYKEKLADYNANLVIVSINSSDIFDVMVRNGIERYGEDSTMIFKAAPWWEDFNKASIILRKFMQNFFGYNHLLMSPSQMEYETKEAARKILETIELWDALCRENGSSLAVIIHPLLEEMMDKEYDVGIALFQETIVAEKKYAHMDIMQRMLEETTIDESTIYKYFWETDQHFKSLGYKLFADVVCDFIVEEKLIDCQNE